MLFLLLLIYTVVYSSILFFVFSFIATAHTLYFDLDLKCLPFPPNLTYAVISVTQICKLIFVICIGSYISKY
ncbi:hypothetical protein F4810DRAFT_645173 [Camillea tinctor]|nr:hypothetical protein F4810DRAFT_645173 [Camillea tinctor]